jgi:hypothetical protein
MLPSQWWFVAGQSGIPSTVMKSAGRVAEVEIRRARYKLRRVSATPVNSNKPRAVPIDSPKIRKKAASQ